MSESKLVIENFKNEVEHCYYNNSNFLHNLNGPAYIVFEYFDGNLTKMEERYFVNGNLHKEEGPAIIEYYLNGRIKYEVYYCYNMIHNSIGPAHIRYSAIGEIISKNYFINGCMLPTVTDNESLKRYIKLNNID